MFIYATMFIYQLSIPLLSFIMTSSCLWDMPFHSQFTTLHAMYASMHVLRRDLLFTLGTCMWVTVVVLCVCYHAGYYIPCLYIENMVLLCFLRPLLDMHCVAFIVISFPQVKVTFACLFRFLTDSWTKQESNGFLLRRLGCRSSNRSYNSTIDYRATYEYGIGNE